MSINYANGYKKKGMKKKMSEQNLSPNGEVEQEVEDQQDAGQSENIDTSHIDVGQGVQAPQAPQVQIIDNRAKIAELHTKLADTTLTDVQQMELVLEMQKLIKEQASTNPENLKALDEYKAAEKQLAEAQKVLNDKRNVLVTLGLIKIPQAAQAPRGRRVNTTAVSEEEKLNNMLKYARNSRTLSIARYIRENTPVTADQLMKDFGVNESNGSAKQSLRALRHFGLIHFESAALGVMPQLPDGSRQQQILTWTATPDKLGTYNAYLKEHSVTDQL